MTLREAKRVVHRVYALLDTIGEPSGLLTSHIIIASTQNSYALVQGDYDSEGNRKETLFVYENGISLTPADLSHEEIALHETRHIVQFRRGKASFISHDALFLRALSLSGKDGRVMDLLARCRAANLTDAFESDAVFVTALAYELDYPVATALTL